MTTAPAFFRSVSYVASFPGVEEATQHTQGPLVAFVGRSNSGKSTLLSALCDHANLAYGSRRAGKTRLLNYFAVPQGEETIPFHLVDLPGYGYASRSKAEREQLRHMVDRFLLDAPDLRAIVLVLDARRRLESEELGVLQHCAAVGRLCVFARTKWDKLNSKEKREARSRWKKEGWSKQSVAVSAPKRLGLAEILLRLRPVLATNGAS